MDITHPTVTQINHLTLKFIMSGIAAGDALMDITHPTVAACSAHPLPVEEGTQARRSVKGEWEGGCSALRMDKAIHANFTAQRPPKNSHAQLPPSPARPRLMRV